MKKYGLVLGGGGARGSYEIGVWKALREMKIPLCAVVGASVGALNGAIIVQDEFEKVEHLWQNITLEHVVKVQRAIENIDEKEMSFKTKFNTIMSALFDGGLDATPLRKLLKDTIDEEKIRKAPMDFGLITFSVTDFEPVSIFKKDIPQGKMVDYLLASACLPIFKKQQIGNKAFLDGGFYNNIPANMLTKKGIKDLVVVDIAGPGFVQKVDTKQHNIIYIKSKQSLGGILEFSPQRAKRNIEMGYKDALKKFGNLTGVKYYFIPCTDGCKIEYSEWKKIYYTLGMRLDGKITFDNRIIKERIKGALLEYSVGKLTEHNAFLAMVEITSEQLKINKQQIYTIDELLNEIQKKYQGIVQEPDFHKKVQEFKEMVFKFKDLSFDKKLEHMITHSKLLMAYNLYDESTDEALLWFNKFIAVTYPKLAIANAIISILQARENLK